MRIDRFLIVCFVCSGLCSEARADFTLPQHIEHLVSTEDGIDLPLLELLKEDGSISAGQSLLLVHGFQTNWHSFIHLSRIYRDLGYRVFLGSLRGHHADTYSISPEKMTFEHLVAFDAPALIEYVYAESEGQPVIYQGHSMGGMVLHLALAGLTFSSTGELILSESQAVRIAKMLKAFIPTASPLSMQMTLEGLTLTLDPLVQRLREFDRNQRNIAELDPSGILSGIHQFNLNLHYHLIKHWPPASENGITDISQVNLREYRYIANYWSEWVPSALKDQIERLRQIGYRSNNGFFDYRQLSMRSFEAGHAPFAQVNVPTFLISGTRDRVAPLDEQLEFASKQDLPHLTIRAAHLDIIGSARHSATIAHWVHQAVGELQLDPEAQSLTQTESAKSPKGLSGLCRMLTQKLSPSNY